MFQILIKFFPGVAKISAYCHKIRIKLRLPEKTTVSDGDIVMILLSLWLKLCYNNEIIFHQTILSLKNVSSCVYENLVALTNAFGCVCQIWKLTEGVLLGKMTTGPDLGKAINEPQYWLYIAILY